MYLATFACVTSALKKVFSDYFTLQNGWSLIIITQNNNNDDDDDADDDDGEKRQRVRVLKIRKTIMW